MPDPKPILSRREFLKVGGVVIAVSFLFSACGPIEVSPVELQEGKINIGGESVIFDGKTVLVDELPDEAKAIYLKTKSSLEKKTRKNKDEINLNRNVAGYYGKTLEEENLINEGVAIQIYTSDNGHYIAQAFVGQKDPDKTGLKALGDNLFVSHNYLKKSMLVVTENGEFWMDNVETTFQGKISRIDEKYQNHSIRYTLDAKSGKLYQIITSVEDLSVENVFRGRDHKVSVFTIDVFNDSVSSGFSIKTYDFFGEKNAQAIKSTIAYLRNNGLNNDQIISYLVDELYLSENIQEDVIKNLGDSEESDESLYQKEPIPFNEKEMAIILSRFLSVFNIANLENNLENPFSVDNLEPILNDEIYLPTHKPDLYIFKENIEGEEKFFLVARYKLYDVGIDRSVFASEEEKKSFLFSPYGGGFYYSYGEIPKELVARIPQNKIYTYGKELPAYNGGEESNEQKYDGIKKTFSENNPLFGTSYDNLEEVRRLDPGIIRYFWNPQAKRIETGVPIIDDNGAIRIMTLKFDNDWGSDIGDLPEYSNRWSLIGTSPNMLVDVTEQVVELRKQGIDSVTPFGLDFLTSSLVMSYLPKDEKELTVLINNLPDENLRTILYEEFNLEENKNIIGDVISAFKDNLLVLLRPLEDGQMPKIYKYNGASIEPKEKITVKEPIILSVGKIGEFIGGEPYLVIGERNGDKYVVRAEDVFPVGARSDLEVIFRNALIVAGLYGGWKLINLPQVQGFIKPTYEIIKGIIRSLVVK
jgi:hypothetical protein